MASKTISAWEARRNFGKLMNEVSRENQPIVVESHGEAKVGIVPMRLIERWNRERETLTEILNRANENVVLTEEEAADLISAEIAKDRAEQRSKADAA